jgi:hypothetical protein
MLTLAQTTGIGIQPFWAGSTTGWFLVAQNVWSCKELCLKFSEAEPPFRAFAQAALDKGQEVDRAGSLEWAVRLDISGSGLYADGADLLHPSLTPVVLPTAATYGLSLHRRSDVKR